MQEAVAARGYYDAAAAMVVTNAGYTAQARVLARKNGVALWDREELISVLLNTDQTAGSPQPRAAACADCGKSVSEAVVRYCDENADRFTGAIYCYPHQRRFRGAACDLPSGG